MVDILVSTLVSFSLSVGICAELRGQNTGQHGQLITNDALFVWCSHWTTHHLHSLVCAHCVAGAVTVLLV